MTDNIDGSVAGHKVRPGRTVYAAPTPAVPPDTPAAVRATLRWPGRGRWCRDGPGPAVSRPRQAFRWAGVSGKLPPCT